MTTLKLRLIESLFLCTVFSGLAGSIVSASPATDALEHLNKQLNSANSISFTATVTTPAQKGKSLFQTLKLQGIVQKPNLLKVTVLSATGADAASNLPVTMTCDGSKYIVYSKGLGQYAQSTAPKKSFESDSPEVLYFILSVLRDQGPQTLDTANLFFPADFNIADEKLPAGLKRKIVASSTYRTFDGMRVQDIAQRVTGAHSTRIYHAMLSPSHNFVGWVVDSVAKNGKVTNEETLRFLSLVVSPQKLPSTDFGAQQLASAKLFHAPASPGMAAPGFTVNDPKSGKVMLADYKGDVVVIDFWATWCPPCLATLPYTDKLAAQEQSKGVFFLPICTWDTKKNFNVWLTKHPTSNMTWLFDPAADSQSHSIASKLYAVAGIPTQYVIGRNGKIVYRGFADTDAGEKPLIEAIDKAAAM